MDKLLISIDGPAASGKGTVARLLGEKLNLPVLYTGNIYRAIAFKIWLENYDPNSIVTTLESAKKLSLADLENNPQLNEEIVGQYASIIGSFPELRQATFKFQRDFIESSTNGAVIEGRDIGTVICPEAKYKFYITAEVEVRARRRASQIHDDHYDIVLRDLIARDERDMNRPVAPLKPAKDAIIIDNSYLSIEETLAKIFSFVIPK